MTARRAQPEAPPAAGGTGPTRGALAGNATKRASLPLYGLKELQAAKSAFWRALHVEYERAGGKDAPPSLDFGRPIVPPSIEPDTLFTQLCGYPFQKKFRTQAFVLAAPVYEAVYCDGATHCGVFVVRRESPCQCLGDLRGCSFVFGGPLSNSGMNLPRRAIADVAGGSPFFEKAVETDSQVANLELVAGGEADATCVDTVTYAFVERHRPQLAALTRVLAVTPPSPSIPFVTSVSTPPATVERLRVAIEQLVTAPQWAAALDGLMLGGIVRADASDYECLIEYENEAVALGYPVIC